MKTTVRAGVFETNSSSTHSLTLVSLEDYEAWERGEKVWDRYNGDLIQKTEETTGSRYQTCEKYFDNEDFEVFEDRITTKNGDTVVAFGHYGFDS